MNHFTLYRKVCLKEINDIRNRLFHIPSSLEYDTRKWFTDSLVGAARFQNPYVDLSSNPEVVIRIEVDESFLEYQELKKVIFQKNEKYKFYRNSSIQGPIIVCPTHLVTMKYSSYGMKEEALQILNQNVRSIDLFGLEEICELYLQEELGVTRVEDLVTSFSPSSENYFYIGMPYDLGLALKKQHLIFSEGMKAGRKKKISRNFEALKQLESKLPVFLAVELEDNVVVREWMNYLQRSDILELELKDILKINEWIKAVHIVDCDLSKDYHQVYQSIGSNRRQLHIPKNNPLLKPLTVEQFELFKKSLQNEDFVWDTIFPFFADMKDCHQLDPKHIDDVFDHATKGITELNQVLEILSFVYEPTENEKYLMQLALLFHDIGKPYTVYRKQVDRYTQFAHHYEQYGKKIVEQLFLDIPEKEEIEILSSLSIVTGCRQYHCFYEKLKNVLSEKELEKFVWFMFLIKTAHIMTLKPQKFCAYYQEQIGLLRDFLFYNERTWRKDNKNNQFITEQLVGQLPALESLLQPEVEVVIDESVESRNPILLDLLDTEIRANYANDFEKKKSSYSNIGEQIELREAISLLKSSPCYPLFCQELSSIQLEQLLKSKTHGVYHNEKVAFFACLIATLKRCSLKDISILLKASIYHDCGRENDRDETRHGLLGARKFDQLFQNILSEEDRKIICFIIEAHAIPDSSIEELFLKYQVEEQERNRYLSLAHILKDADGLDRIRISMDLPYSKLNPNYLRNTEAMNLIKVSHQLNEYYKKQIIFEGNLIPKKVYQKRP